MSTRPPSLLHSFAKPAAPADAYVNVVSAAGATVTDAEGREYVDALAALWYCQVGHGEQRIAEAVTKQLGVLDTFHTFDRFTNPPADALADALVDVAPMPDARVFLTTGGSEAGETALKLARLSH
jgi:adenosylmethionine-8-amino-7-oxononanoate aminotransferase